MRRQDAPERGGVSGSRSIAERLREEADFFLPTTLPVLTGEREYKPRWYNRLTLRTSRRNLRGRMPDITVVQFANAFCRYIASENL